ncbi:MAG: RNA chaperone Hfq [Gammaproteobacteria bacterium]
MQKNAQERFLSNLCRERTRVLIYLVGGIRLEGYIKSFDAYVLYMDEPVAQLIYKRAVCSVLPAPPKVSRDSTTI